MINCGKWPQVDGLEAELACCGCWQLCAPPTKIYQVGTLTNSDWGVFRTVDSDWRVFCPPRLWLVGILHTPTLIGRNSAYVHLNRLVGIPHPWLWLVGIPHPWLWLVGIPHPRLWLVGITHPLLWLVVFHTPDSDWWIFRTANYDCWIFRIPDSDWWMFYIP